MNCIKSRKEHPSFLPIQLNRKWIELSHDQAKSNVRSPKRYIFALNPFCVSLFKCDTTIFFLISQINSQSRHENLNNYYDLPHHGMI